LRISFSCSTGTKAFLFRFHDRSTFEFLNPSSRVLAPLAIDTPEPPRVRYPLRVAATEFTPQVVVSCSRRFFLIQESYSAVEDSMPGRKLEKLPDWQRRHFAAFPRGFSAANHPLF
jgi:hypothetical protein